MNVIDVNGQPHQAEDNQEQTAMDVNLAAAKEIARHLPFLRDLGGIVIIDFIDLHQGAEQTGALRRDGEADGRRQGQAHRAFSLTKFD